MNNLPNSPPAIPRDEAIAGFRQSVAATAALDMVMRSNLPDPDHIVSCMEHGALLEHLSWKGWPRILIEHNMVESMRFLLGCENTLHPDTLKHCLDALTLEGTPEMFDAVFEFVSFSQKDLYQALYVAVLKDQLNYVQSLVAHGAPLSLPEDQGDKNWDHCRHIQSREMFDFLKGAGAQFTKTHLIRSCIFNAADARLKEKMDAAPRVDLLRHMLENGVPLDDPSSRVNPASCLLLDPARALTFRTETVECLTVLREHGHLLEDTLQYKTGIPALLLLLDAGVSLEALKVARPGKSHSDWDSWEDHPLQHDNDVDQLLVARDLLIELDQKGLTVNELGSLTMASSSWKMAFYLAGCTLETLKPDWVDPKYEGLHEAAILSKTTQHVKPVARSRRL